VDQIYDGVGGVRSVWQIKDLVNLELVNLYQTSSSFKLRLSLDAKKFCKRTIDSPSHRIFGRMHKALNIDKKIKPITQFRRNGRDESFKPN
jgi:hypothetical protein